MSAFPQFVGPTYTAASPIADAERLVNWYPERVDGHAKGQNELWYRTCPGTTPFVTVPRTNVRGLFSLNGRVFSVVGDIFFELLSNGTWRPWGSVVNSPAPVTMCSNGDGGFQVFIVSGGSGYIFDLVANNLTLINPAVQLGFPTIAVQGAFCDGYFIVLEAHSGKFHISNLEDGTVWDALDVAQVSESSNRIISLLVDHRRVWLFGEQTTEVWYNSGYANFPFQPDQGAFLEQGIVAPYSASKIDNSLMWLGGNEHGINVCYRADGGSPKRISTHAIESTWATYRATTNAIGWTYQEEGHPFYVLYFPSGPLKGDHVTWVYDVSTDLWHERGLWDTNFAKYVPAAGRCHCVGFGKHLVGDRSSGTIYIQSARLFGDDVNETVFG